MHRLDIRKYVGAPNEPAFISTTVEGGGHVRKELNGVPLPSEQFLLGAVGERQRLQIVLEGPLNASCVVGISEVDGGTDGDLLVCQTHDPAPAQFYDFSAVPAAAVRSLGMVRAAPPGAAARPAAAPKAARPKAARRSGKKTARRRGRR